MKMLRIVESFIRRGVQFRCGLQATTDKGCSELHLTKHYQLHELLGVEGCVGLLRMIKTRHYRREAFE